jgi:hypothetical protein
MNKTEKMPANCKYCDHFVLHDDYPLGFCLKIYEFVNEESYTEECDDFELDGDKLDDYNNWLESLK